MDMPRPRLPYLSHEMSRHGRKQWYFKKNGKRIRLPDEYGSKEFRAAYNAALAGVEAPKRPPDGGSLTWLVDQYKRSRQFAELAPSTRRMRDNILKRITEKAGHLPYARITRAHIEKGMTDRAATPHAANNYLKVVNQLFNWAAGPGALLTSSPGIGVKKARDASDGFHTWTIDEVERYRLHHKLGSRARLAIELLLFLGLRRSDVIHAGRQHVKDGVLSMKTQKTGTWVHIPIFAKLQDAIDAAPTGDLTFLVTEKGTPFTSASSFGNWFAVQCKAAGLPNHCRAHGLRKAGATIAADEGATPHELMAMFGWSRVAMAEVYTREADKKRQARSAAKRIDGRM